MKIGDRIYVHGYVDEIRKNCVIVRNDGGYFGTVKSEIVEAQETEDIVSVIRCKDCKHSEPWYADKRRCFLWSDAGIDVFEDGFCNYAERKEE